MYGLFLVGVAVFAAVANWQAIGENFFDWEIAKAQFPRILTVAARNTVVFTLIAFAGGLVVGLVLAVMRLSSITPYRWASLVYIEIFRGLPALLTMFLFAFGFPLAFGFRLPGGTNGAALLGLTLVAAAYIAETIRAGIQAVPKGQTEAARSLGMGRARTLVTVVIPQALRIVVPPLTNEIILLIKDTSLLALVGVTANQEELTKFARDGLISTSNSTPLIVAGALYLLITIPMTSVVRRLETRNRQAR